MKELLIAPDQKCNEHTGVIRGTNVRKVLWVTSVAIASGDGRDGCELP